MVINQGREGSAPRAGNCRGSSELAESVKRRQIFAVVPEDHHCNRVVTNLNQWTRCHVAFGGWDCFEMSL
jgi:hypothetical protein